MKRDEREWLETDGLGGFASGAVSLYRTRRYHALLLTAAHASSTRFVLVNGLEATVATPQETFALSSQRYAPHVTHPDGYRRIESFTVEPWPTWIFRGPDGTRLRYELFIPRGSSAVVLKWTLLDAPVEGRVALRVRLLMSGRDYHALHLENSDFDFRGERNGARIQWRPYEGVPGTIAHCNGDYRADPLWYRQFLYTQEEERGLDCVEDLASPGSFQFDLRQGPAVCLLTAEGEHALEPPQDQPLADFVERLAAAELDRRSQFPNRLHRAADQYLIDRGGRQTIIAGYPWFTDWGRDSFISLRGLCFITGRLDDARDILLDWSQTISQGMVPNRFPDRSGQPEYNSVDASLWYVIAVGEYLQTCASRGKKPKRAEQAQLVAAVEAILAGYSEGTRYGIRADDGLLACGESGTQLTWMDAKVDGWVVTPRVGKPVEVQALWINALAIGARLGQAPPLLERAKESFRRRFWNAEAGCLYDVVDVDHESGRVDGAVRPNQILAVGGLPLNLLAPEPARRVVDLVEQKLLAAGGLRTLDLASPNYHPHYIGDLRQRDAAYHQGTIWPWLIGPFVHAWVRVRGETAAARFEARDKFLPPLKKHLDEAGIGHLSEILDGDPPHTPRGCPFQAWSLAALLWLEGSLLTDGETATESTEGEDA